MALSQSNEITLFGHESIQKIINYHWKNVNIYIYTLFIVPYMIQLSAFFIWSNVILGNESSPIYLYANLFLVGILLVFSCYFIILELAQWKSKGFEYLKDPWNYLDWTPLVLIVVNCVRSLTEETYTSAFWRTQAFAAILMWFKFFYFLRSLDSTSYLVRIITNVAYDMIQFMVIFGMTVVGYADAFYSASNALPVEERFIGSYVDSLLYTYLLTLGEFGTDNFDALSWFLFISATIINLIIMLNLLIAVISETFANAGETKEEAKFKERVAVMADLLGVIGPIVYESGKSSDMLLFFAENARGSTKEFSIEEQVDDLNQKIDS